MILKKIVKLGRGLMKSKSIEPKSYLDFKNALGARESGNNYKAKNTLGYLGKYQFGLARLSDFGLCKRKEGVPGWSNKCFTWVEPFSEERFLKEAELQEKIFDIHIGNLCKRVKRIYADRLDKEVNGHFLTLSGAVACVHLLGMGGLIDFFDSKIGSDAYGTKATDYIDLFCGYDIPDGVGRGIKP